MSSWTEGLAVAAMWFGINLLAPPTSAFGLYYACIAVIGVTIIVCEVLLWKKPKSNAQLYIVGVSAFLVLILMAALFGVLGRLTKSSGGGGNHH